MNINEYAGLAWYHQWHLDPKTALDEWEALAEGLRHKTAMSEHLTVVGWLAPLRSEPPTSGRPEYARMLVSYGIELWRASLGDRTQNLHEAIVCYDQALEEITRDKFPQD